MPLDPATAPHLAGPPTGTDQHLLTDDLASDLADATTSAPGPADAPDRSARGARGPRRWLPRRVLVTASAAQQSHGRAMVQRCEAAGLDVQLLRADRLPSTRGGDERAAYALAKATLAVVTSPPSATTLVPIPPSADFRLDLATGCPAHCQYCYLAGSLAGPPLTRAYADLPRVLGAIRGHVGRGRITSTSRERAGEGTTFEVSCYTDPLGIEHLTGSLAAAITHVGTTDLGGPVGLRFTTKFDDVGPLLGLPHGGRTRMRFSVNTTSAAADASAGGAGAATTSSGYAGVERFEGGTARMPQRLAAMARAAGAGYPVGLVIAPVVPDPGWEGAYARLLDDAAAALSGLGEVDLTTEVITHRFSSRSREVLQGWYPRTRLEMDPEVRAQKRGKYGAVKHVYPPETMAAVRAWFAEQVDARLPGARQLYFT